MPNVIFEGARLADILALGGTRPPELRLPSGFCLNGQGQLCAVLQAGKVKGELQPARLQVLIFNRIGPPTLRFRDNHFGIEFTAEIARDFTTKIFLTSTHCYIAHGLLGQLARKGMLYNTEWGARTRIGKFFFEWLDKLRCEDAAVRDPVDEGAANEPCRPPLTKEKRPVLTGAPKSFPCK